MDEKKECPCKRKCVRHGDCEACKEQHKTKSVLPACERIQRKKERKREQQA